MSNLPQDDRITSGSSLSDGKESKDDTVAEELHRRYHRLIYYFLRIFQLPHEHHDDLFNQIFLKIISGLSKLKHADNLKSWVVTITKNEIFGYLNKRNREKHLYETTTRADREAFEHKSPVSKEATPEKVMHISQLHETFEEAVEMLDDSIAQPFLLRYRDKMRWKQIAEKLELNEDTARKRSNKARDLIRQHFHRKFGPISPKF